MKTVRQGGGSEIARVRGLSSRERGSVSAPKKMLFLNATLDLRASSLANAIERGPERGC